MSDSQRVMIVTVGTSLFTSASWKPQGPLADIEGYELWASEADLLRSPAARARMCRATGNTVVTGSAVEAGIEKAIRNDSDAAAGQLEALLETEPVARYSAELATIVGMWKTLRPEQGQGITGFLTASYRELRLLCSSDENDRSYLAATQLKAQLATLNSGLGGIVQLSSRIAGSSVVEKAASFKAVIDALEEDSGVDFVISGGYKIYAAIVTRLLRGNWRVFYLHEEEAQLVTTDVFGQHIRLSSDNGVTLLLGGIAGGHE